MNLLHPRNDSNTKDLDHSKSGSGMSGWGIFFLTVFLLLVVAFAIYVIFVHVRARRLGLPSPSWKSFIPFANSTRGTSSRPSTGVFGFIKSKLPGGERSGGGGTGLGGSTGYTGAAERSRSTRAQFGQLRQDDDEAWDARAYHGYDDDTELGDARGRGAYEGYSGGTATTRFGASVIQPYTTEDLDEYGEPIRGRSKSREPPASATTYPPVNPRVEQVRAMSPRPLSGDSFGVVSVKGGRASLDGEKRSIFREDIS